MAAVLPYLIAAIGSYASAAAANSGTNNFQNTANAPGGASPNNQQPSPFSMQNAAPEPGPADVQAPDKVPTPPTSPNVPQNATIGDILAATPSQPGQAPQNPSAAAAATTGGNATSSQIMQGISAALKNPMVLQMLGFGPHDQRLTVLPAPAGSHGGQMVQGYNLPGHVSIGEILNSLPRAHYGG